MAGTPGALKRLADMAFLLRKRADSAMLQHLILDAREAAVQAALRVRSFTALPSPPKAAL